MTVVVGFVSPDGAVMASDSEATDSGGLVRRDVEKIWTCGDLLMGYTGNVGIAQLLRLALDDAVATAPGGKVPAPRIASRKFLRETVARVLHGEYQFHVGDRDGNGVPLALDGILLIIGRDASGYWMLEIAGTAAAEFYTDEGFHTVGSGAAAAYVARSLMRDYVTAGRDVDDLKLFAHRTVQTCIDTAGGGLGVGGRVHLWTARGGDASFLKVPPREMEEIQYVVEQWRSLERESLGQVRRRGAPEPEGVPLPEPPVPAPDTAASEQTDT